jgi:hypothetical protein
VIIQAWEPDGRPVALAARHAVGEFLDGELERRAELGYPPYRRLVRVLVTLPSHRWPRTSLPRWPTRRRRRSGDDQLLGRHRCSGCVTARAATCW